ncbi:MAG: serine/threonine protein kinase, partial [Myxococcales bacterium]|nr:serine/threonine protein kinase [Myxococcales bacterium]
MIATVIDGRYRIERLMGSGGMSRVYLGTSVKTGVQLAIKLIDLQLSGDPAMQQRILGEARAMMSLQSNHIVHALDVGSLASGQLYIVMEFLDGEDLDALLVREGPLPWARVADIGAQICSGLATAHRRGIVHRDIKPQNCIRVTVDDNPEHIKIIDFGVARDLEAAAGPTLQGFLVGTPEYMAPEFLQRGVRAEPRTDIYALGATLYKLLTGVVPYRGANALTTLDMHATSPLIPPSKRAPEFEIPPEADEIIGRALAKTPETRYGSADELARALRSALGVQRSGLLRRPEGSAIAAVERPATTPPVAAAPGRPGDGWRPVDALQAAAAAPRDASAVVSEASLHASTVPWRAARAEARPGETPATGTR